MTFEIRGTFFGVCISSESYHLVTYVYIHMYVFIYMYICICGPPYFRKTPPYYFTKLYETADQAYDQPSAASPTHPGRLHEEPRTSKQQDGSHASIRNGKAEGAA